MNDTERARLIAALTHLKVPFDRKQISKLPASSGRPAIDYVNHAHVTSRLNAFAEDWSFTVDEQFTHDGKFWIRGTMTICGVSRVEYGQGKNPLEAASHFVRRAAMRFGVATDLWAKEDLESWEPAAPAPARGALSPEPVGAAVRPEPEVYGEGTEGSGSTSLTEDAGPSRVTPSVGAVEGAGDAPASLPPPDPDGPISTATLNQLLDVYHGVGKALAAARRAGHKLENVGGLTEAQGLDLIAAKLAA